MKLRELIQRAKDLSVDWDTHDRTIDQSLQAVAWGFGNPPIRHSAFRGAGAG